MVAVTPQRKILVVDDHEPDAELVAAMLSPRYRVFAASSSEDALSVFDREDPDLVILDLRLGDGAGGIGIFQAIRRRIGHAPKAILVSSADEAEDSARAAHMPMLRKPLRQRPLLDMVDRVMGGR
ncbi:MAG TPA: response regulator [Candidatus Acidoferrales bacterium]|nr:response regulator [Candidatus Acidoferrales bacterium]